MDVDFRNGVIPASFTFSRASAANMVDDDGTFSTHAIDAPRFMAGQGLLLEAGLSNYASYSRDLTQAAKWNATNISAAKNAVGIDGTANSCTTLTATADNGTILQPYSSASNLRRTFSARVKRKTGTGAISMTLDGGTTWTVISPTSTFSRFVIYWTGTNPSAGFKMATSGDEIIVDACQLQAQTTANVGGASSPIFTDATAVARSQDLLVSAGSWFNPTEGTLLVIGKFLDLIPAASLGYCTATIGDGGVTDYITMGELAGNNDKMAQSGKKANTSIGITFWPASYAVYAGNRFRAGHSYSATKCAQAIDGKLDRTNAVKAPNAFPTMNQIIFGCRAASNIAFPIVIERIAYWPFQMDEELIRRMTA